MADYILGQKKAILEGEYPYRKHDLITEHTIGYILNITMFKLSKVYF